ncbi:MAG TPA: 2OG-Fe(II) oxygenase [Candidatus Binatia bacterium]|nr:2OG-Fe(II) oxygenase [Candidatus Binatia bacterium]
MSPRSSHLAARLAGDAGTADPVDLRGLAARLRPLSGTFGSAEPFPHVVLDDFLPESVAEALAAEFDDASIAWQSLHHVNERKLVFGDREAMGPVGAAVVSALQSPGFRSTLERLTGVPGLFGDPDLDGAGFHRTEPGGHLNVHADALAHSKRRTWSRQLNLILFLNRDWQEAYRGWLELWDARVERCVRRISPVFNRAVVFRTSAISFHGVPEGVACPPGHARKSLALYYYRDESRTVALQPTRYVPRPGDPPLRRALIRLDRAVLALYSLLKRYTPLDDARVARILRRF